MEIGKRTMVMKSITASRTYQTAVREKFPQGINNTTDRGRYLSEARADAERGRNHENRNGRNSDRSRSRNVERSRHRDQEEIVLRNGEKIDYHPSYNFSKGQLRAMTDRQRDRLRNERIAYRESQGWQTRHNTQTQIAELRAEVASLRSGRNTEIPAAVGTDGTTAQISQVTLGTDGSSVMGGRNQQASGRRT